LTFRDFTLPPITHALGDHNHTSLAPSHWDDPVIPVLRSLWFIHYCVERGDKAISNLL